MLLSELPKRTFLGKGRNLIINEHGLEIVASETSFSVLINCLFGKAYSSLPGVFPYPTPTHHTAWVSSTIAIHWLCGRLCFLFRNWLLFFFIQTNWVLKILFYYACVCLRLDICYDCWLFIALGSRDCVTIHNARRSLRCVQIVLHHNFTIWSKSHCSQQPRSNTTM